MQSETAHPSPDKEDMERLKQEAATPAWQLAAAFISIGTYLTCLEPQQVGSTSTPAGILVYVEALAGFTCVYPADGLSNTLFSPDHIHENDPAMEMLRLPR